MEIRKLYGLLYALMAALLLVAGGLAILTLITRQALAATGDARYEALFWHTLAIRDGCRP